MFIITKQLEKWVIYLDIKELFDYANKNQFADMQALIMFLVFEKQVVSMYDGTTALDLFFLDKHHDRMNQELKDYKAKMKMKYKANVFHIESRNKSVYVYAYSEAQAKQEANSHLLQVDSITACYMDDLMTLNGKDMTFRTMVQDEKVPTILGGF